MVLQSSCLDSTSDNRLGQAVVVPATISVIVLLCVTVVIVVTIIVVGVVVCCVRKKKDSYKGENMYHIFFLSMSSMTLLDLHI